MRLSKTRNPPTRLYLTTVIRPEEDAREKRVYFAARGCGFHWNQIEYEDLVGLNPPMLESGFAPSTLEADARGFRCRRD